MPLNLALAAEDRRFASEIFSRFSARSGSAHIASRTALEYLAACLRQFQPSTVLELGAGIGTVTEAILSHPAGIQRLVSTEADTYCLSVLKGNLSNGEAAGRFQVVTTPAELRQLRLDADLVVADGGFYSEEEVNCCREGTVLFFEGNRKQLRQLFENVLQKRGLHIHLQHFGPDESTQGRGGLLFRWRRRKKPKGCWIGRVENSGPSQRVRAQP